TAAEFGAELSRAASGPAEPARVADSIAVLPFANLSGDAGNEYLSDGITEEILNALTQLDSVRVAARTSAFSFKGSQRDAREIARTLNVRHLLQGSVRRAASRVRISVQLVDAASGFQQWSETYDRELADVFAVQDEIAAIVARR